MNRLTSSRVVARAFPLGAAVSAITAVLVTGCGGGPDPGAALTRSAQAYSQLTSASHDFARHAKACTAGASPASLACVEEGDAVMSTAYARFAAAIAVIPMPTGDPQTVASRVRQAAAQTAGALHALRSSTTMAQYHLASGSSPVLGDASVVQEDYGYLRTLLANGG